MEVFDTFVCRVVRGVNDGMMCLTFSKQGWMLKAIIGSFYLPRGRDARVVFVSAL